MEAWKKNVGRRHHHHTWLYILCAFLYITAYFAIPTPWCDSHFTVMSNVSSSDGFFQSRGRGGHIFTGYPFCMVAKMEKQEVWRMNCKDAIILGCVLLRIYRVFCIFYLVGTTPSYLVAYCCAFLVYSVYLILILRICLSLKPTSSYGSHSTVKSNA